MDSLHYDKGQGKMPFQKLPNNKGLIYIPECGNYRKKQPCRDCFSCQWCGEERCRVCRPDDYVRKKIKTGKISG